MSAHAEALSSAAGGGPWLSIVGLGEDGRAGLSRDAAAALDRADLVVGGSRHLALVAPIAAAATLAWPSPMSEGYAAILAWRGRGRVCVLATGDPFHYGVGADLAALLAPDDWVCFPGVSAFSLAAARLGWSLPDCALVSVHGRALERVVPHLQPGARILALSANGTTPAKLAALLVGRGFGGAVLTVLERMGGPAERVRRAPADGFALDGIDGLNTLAVEIPAAVGAARVVPLTAGLDDSWFDHDGQLTKAEIRALTLAALAPRAGELLWDVGAGAGSVAIEWCLRHPGNRAVAIEARPDRAVRLESNARALGVADRIRAVEGRAPAALGGLPSPHAVFIGGGASDPDVVDAAWGALGGGGRLVINAVTLETEAALAERHARHGGAMRRIAVSRLVPVGGYHGWRPAMPVTQWAVVKP